MRPSVYVDPGAYGMEWEDLFDEGEVHEGEDWALWRHAHGLPVPDAGEPDEDEEDEDGE